jgi:Flp pilus assembly protein TadG
MSRRHGATAIMTCACMTGILFLAAMAIDAGNLLAARRHAQNCCDAAALAGAIKLATLQAQGSTPGNSDITGAVNTSASHNNFTDGSNCTVAVHWPPSSGSFASNNNAVEVDVTFTKANMVVTGSNTVTVRSVATCDASASTFFPMLLLEPTGSKSFWVTSGNLTMSGAPVHVNSTSTTAAVVEGSGSSIANATVQVVGGSSGGFTPAAVTGDSPLANPLALLPVPSTSGLTTHSQSSYLPDSSGKVALTPGYYPNGLYVINGGNVTMAAGLYYIEGGNFWINTTGTVTANNVTIYHNGPNSSALLNTNYGLNVGICLCPTNGNYTFTPPTTGTYAGVSFFHGPDVTSEAFYDFWGSAVLTVGLQYFPKSTLRCWSVTNGLITCNELIALDLKLTGTHEIYGTSQNGGFSKVTWTASRASNRPLTNVVLVE